MHVCCSKNNELVQEILKVCHKMCQVYKLHHTQHAPGLHRTAFIEKKILNYGAKSEWGKEKKKIKICFN